MPVVNTRGLEAQLLGSVETSKGGVAPSSTPINTKGLDQAMLDVAQVQPDTATAPAQPTGEFSITNSLERGYDGLRSNIADALGNHDEAKAWEAKAAAPDVAPSVPTWDAVHDVKSGAKYVAERAAENLVQMGVPIAAAVASPIIGPTAAATIGIGSNLIPQFGEARGNIIDASGTDHPLMAGVVGVANSALDYLPVASFAKGLGLQGAAQRAVAKAMADNPGLFAKLAHGVVGTGKQMALEGVTEGWQELNSIVAENIASDKDALSLSQDQRDRIRENAIAGAAVGGAFHIGGHSMKVVGGKLLPADSVDAEKALADSMDTDADKAVREQVARVQQIQDQIAANDEILKAAAARRAEQDTGNHDDIIAASPLSSDTKPLEGNTAISPDEFTESFARSLLEDHWTESGTNILVRDDKGNSVVMPMGVDQIPRGVHVAVDSVASADPQNHAHLLNIADHVNDVVSKMGLSKDIRIIIGNHIPSLFVSSDLPTTRGYSSPIGDNSFYIVAKPLKDVSSQFDNVPVSRKDDVQSTAFYNTVNHEVGHAIFQTMMTKTATLEERNALLQSYKEWLLSLKTYRDLNATSDSLAGTYNEAHIRKEFPNYGNAPFSYIKQKDPKFADEIGQYNINFDEFVARSFGRYMASKTATGEYTPVTSLFKKLADMMRKYFRIIKKTQSTNETFKAFVDNTFLKRELEQLQAQPKPAAPDTSGIEVEANNTGFSNSKANGVSEENIHAVNESVVSSVKNFLHKLGMKKQAANFGQHADLHLGFAKYAQFFTPIQIAELAQKSGYALPAQYMDIVRAYSNLRAQYSEEANQHLSEWNKLGNQKAATVSRLLFEISQASDEKGRALNKSELDALFTKLKAGPDEIALWRKIDQHFRDTLDKMHSAMIYEQSRSYTEDYEKAKVFRDAWLAATTEQEKMNLIEQFTGEPMLDPNRPNDLFHPLYTQLKDMERKIKGLKNKNYFPRSRLGEYYVRVVSKSANQSWDGTDSTKAGETLGFYSFDNIDEAKSFMADNMSDAQREGVAISVNKMPSEIFAMQSMPQALIKTISDRMQLTDEQRRIMADIALDLSPGKRFLKHLKKRKGIAGYTEDATRVYVNYMLNASSHMARTEYARDMISELHKMNKYIKDLEGDSQGRDLTNLTRLKDYYTRHMSYIMKADNDWANLRALGFMWFLGFNPKAAWVNLTQVPMVTLPYLSSRYGDVKATKAMISSWKKASQHLMGKKRLSNDEMAMIDHFINTGIFDESIATELAGLAEGGTLKRMLPGVSPQKMYNKFLYASGFMFRATEKFNRYTTALAAYNLARDHGISHEMALQNARQAIETTQFEPVKWNRAEFMRGKKSVIFMFWSYMQHMAFLFFGGDGKGTAMRMLIMSMIAGGLTGLPFAEALFALIDASGSQIKALFGDADPRVESKKALRELLMNITDNPDIMMRGLSSQFGLGPIHLAANFGIPIPRVDIHSSMSNGYMLPWLQSMMEAHGSSDEKVGQMAAGLAGPIAGLPILAYKAIQSDDPSVWKRISSVMPVFVKNAMQGAQWLNNGGVQDQNGAMTLPLSDIDGRVAAVLKMSGFTPTALTQKYQQITAQKEAAAYFAARRGMLLQDLYQGIANKDREAIADARKAIADFNKMTRETVELRGMGITGQQANSSVRARLRDKVQKERNLPSSRSSAALEASIRKAYPVIGEQK